MSGFQFFFKLSPTPSQSNRFTTSKHIIQKFLINNFIIKTFFENVILQNIEKSTLTKIGPVHFLMALIFYN